MMRGTYIGPRPDLQGKKALLNPYPQTCLWIMAQFDDVETGLGQYWHDFPVMDFRVDKEVDDGQSPTCSEV